MRKYTREEIYKKFDGCCAYCGKKIEYKDMQVDHQIPKACIRPENQAYVNSIDNLFPSCRRCNHYKRSMELPFIETAKDAIEKKDATTIELEKINHNVLFTIERVNEIYLSVKESDKRRLRRKEILEFVGFFMKTVILIVLTANFLVSLYTKWIPEVFSIW